MLMKVVSSMWLAPRARKELDRTRWLGTLVQAHRHALTHTALDEGLTADEALDVVQDAAATVLGRADWKRLEDAPDEAGRLLVTLVRNHARNLRKRHWRKDVGLDALPEENEVDVASRQLDDALEEAQAHIALTGCLSTLKATQRAVVVARFFEGSSGAEVAQALGLTAGNVAVTLHRARQQLKSCVESSRVRFGVTR